MVKVLEWPSEQNRFMVKAYSGVAVGDVVKATRDAKIASKTDVPVGILVESISTEFPRPNLIALGQGALIDMETAMTAATVGVVVYSNGDGTLTVTKPTGSGADSNYWKMGIVEPDEAGSATTTRVRVQMEIIRGVS